ncbi:MULTISPECIES: Cof-type HAD-IIB family hydrolase [unclassified Streptococcus]|uniref:Cof-type HAD-IIB family hydrolase n=1 Tax=unclassified Streptococcus TaxID=2608887 RepID=UPI001071E92B|nr:MULTISPECIES: Cof-type HAD-IIB family hydrolase [unclassified Streptococcus]MBF0805515.1 Cof-type HAD-IIB family hydrolase [Streptococcus sp. 19428wA2_WM07]TFU28969.1 Cof-type HAD-IIB family hydrolase [Streptococcus sp. WM07]
MNTKTKYKAKKIKIVFFDIDDTLRVKDTGFIPPSIERVFRDLKKAGIKVGIATGRSPLGVVPELRALKPDYLVTINGAYVENAKGEAVYSHPIPEAQVQAYKEWAEKEAIAYGLVGKEQASLSTRSPLINEAIDIIYPGLEINPDLDQSEAIYQMWTFEEEEQDLMLPEELAQDLRLVRWHPNSCDVVIKEMSKAVGVEKVLDSLNLKPENLLVFGDGLNDLELFDFAGLAVAMGAAIDSVKDKADYVTKFVEEDGIEHALVEMGLIPKLLHFPQLDLDTVEGPVVTLETNQGSMTIKLFPKHAPKTVANFLGLAKEAYYEGVTFHRIIEDFMIQGGDPSGTGMGGESIYGGEFEDEFHEELYNLRGALSMANAGPNTNGSQFFIVQNTGSSYNKKELVRGGWPAPIAAYYAKTGGTPHLDRRHTVFGQLMDSTSFEVLDKIAHVEVDMMDKPLEPVVILKIEVEE